MPIARKLIAETCGTAILLVSIIGSGVAADKYTEGQLGLSLLVHSLVIGAALVALILAFGETSAHFNPAVSFYFFLKKKLSGAELPFYVLAQIIGAILGVVLTHAMFELPLVEAGEQVRSGFGIWLSEFVCTVMLLVIIVGASAHGTPFVAIAVGAFISAAIWCFSSLAFANPAVAIARSFTNTFAAIRPIDVGPFVLAQLAGATLASFLPLAPSQDGED